MTKVSGKSLYDIAVEKKFTTNKQLFEYIRDKKVKLIGGSNRSGHNLPAKFKITGMHANHMNGAPGKNSAMNWSINGSGVWMSAAYLSEICLDSTSVTELREEITKVTTKKEALESQLQICESLGIEEFDEKLLSTIVAIDKVKKSKSKDKLEEAKEFLVAIGEGL